MPEAKTGLPLTRPKFSVVTISFNQAEFLKRTIESVLAQRADGCQVEYIVCDPGSTDGSRDIIDSFGDAIDVKVYDKDKGPADGLNNGFARATGDIFCYLNSDDTFLPGAFTRIEQYMSSHPQVDVVTGHGLAIDTDDKVLRRVWSEPYGRRYVSYGAHIQVQPATFIRAEAYCRSDGFDSDDRSTWDSSLLDNLFLSGSRIEIIDAFLGTYRLHPGSITMSGRLEEMMAQSAARRFERLMGRRWNPSDKWIAQGLRLAKHLRWPHRAVERLRRGPLFMRSA